MDRIKRDNLIIRMAAAGESKGTIADALGLTVSGVRYVLGRNANFIDDREPPVGMKMRTAWMLEQSIGIWPNDADRQEIAERRLEFLRSGNVSLADLRDLDAWLERVR
jgi:hypothetical protein